MPSLLQLESWLKQEIAKGKGQLHTNHVVIVEEESAKRARGEPDAEGKPKTKIAWDSCDPESYAAWHGERERWMRAANHNPVISTDAMLVALRSVPDETIKIIIENLQEIGRKNSTVPKAVIPSEL